MGKLILVRHGETRLNKEKKFFGLMDPELNIKGKEQAQKAGETLEKILKENGAEIRMFSSPLKRALETAEIIGESIGRIPTIREQLKEIDFGIFEGLSYEEIIERYPKEASEAFGTNWHSYNFENGESPIELQQRVVDFVEKELSKSEINILIAHWGVINSIMSFYFSQKLDSYWKFSLSNGGTAVIDFDGEFPVLTGFNIGGTYD